MGFLKRKDELPGPGVEKGTKPKQGPARFFEILLRDLGSLIRINLLYQLVLLPAQLLLFASFFTLGTKWFWLLGAAALLASIPIGPAKTALYYCITQMLRDEPSFIWHEFKRRFKNNFKTTVVPGILFSLLTGSQIFVLWVLLATPSLPPLLLPLFGFSVLVFHMLAPYYFLQAAYLELTPTKLLQNTVVLVLRHLPRTFLGVLCGGGLMALQLLAFPRAVPATVLIGYSLPALFTLFWIWPPVNRQFGISQTIKARQEEALAGIKPLGAELMD